MKVREFESYDNYEATGNYNELDIVKHDKYISADLLTDCKSYKTALNRFFKGLKTTKDYDKNFNGWEDQIKECCKSGSFEETSKYEDGSIHYVYSIEQLDETLWYIYLTVEIYE